MVFALAHSFLGQIANFFYQNVALLKVFPTSPLTLFLVFNKAEIYCFPILHFFVCFYFLLFLYTKTSCNAKTFY